LFKLFKSSDIIIFTCLLLSSLAIITYSGFVKFIRHDIIIAIKVEIRSRVRQVVTKREGLAWWREHHQTNLCAAKVEKLIQYFGEPCEIQGESCMDLQESQWAYHFLQHKD